MRTEVLDYIKSLPLGNFNSSDELPREESGSPLYLKNPRRLYVDRSQFEETPLIQTLGTLSIHTFAETVSVYFTVDAKLLPNNYSQLVDSLLAAKDLNPDGGFNIRQSSVQTEYINDLMLTRVDLVYTKIR